MVSSLKDTWVSVTCNRCERSSSIPRSRAKNNKRFFCSRKCQAESQVVRVEKTCKICSANFKVRPCEARKFSTCSKPCYLKAKSKEANGNWRGGVTSSRKVIMATREYKDWRKAVIDRDNKTCVLCGSTHKIEVDHILPWAYYPELRYEVSNGRCLCRDCHKKTFKEVKEHRKLLESKGIFRVKESPLKPRTVKCNYCFTYFQPKASNGALCSDECRKNVVKARLRARRRPLKFRTLPFNLENYRPEDTPCTICSVVFSPTNARQLYCGKDCRQESIRRKHRKPTLPYTQCDICEQDFTPKSKLQRYCSSKCGRKAETAQMFLARKLKRSIHAE